jgi:hypothetical protein
LPFPSDRERSSILFVVDFIASGLSSVHVFSAFLSSVARHPDHLYYTMFSALPTLAPSSDCLRIPSIPSTIGVRTAHSSRSYCASLSQPQRGSLSAQSLAFAAGRRRAR